MQPRFTRPLLLASCLAGLVGCSKSSSGGTGGREAGGGTGGISPGGGRDGDGGSAAGGGGPSSDAAVAFSKTELLQAFGTCAANDAKTFRTKAAALEAAAAAYESTPDGTSSTRVREAFREAMTSWQVLDVLQFGPTGSNATVPGGKDFRDNIYGWPTFGRCAVDETLVSKKYEAASFGTALLANRRGLAAIEYLLFYEGNETACTPWPEWTALASDERAARRRAYAAAAAKDVASRAAALDEAWDPAKGNFVKTLRTAGANNPVYPTVQAAIESVGLALFYLDRMVKDQKIGVPVDDGCTAATCFETPYSAMSKESIRSNLQGFRQVMEGCDGAYGGLGFDDLLVNIGAGALAETLHTQALAALAALDQIAQPTLDQALAQDPAALNGLRNAIGELTVTIKTSFYTTLSFEPATIPTDNDA